MKAQDIMRSRRRDRKQEMGAASVIFRFASHQFPIVIRSGLFPGASDGAFIKLPYGKDQRRGGHLVDSRRRGAGGIPAAAVRLAAVARPPAHEPLQGSRTAAILAESGAAATLAGERPRRRLQRARRGRRTPLRTELPRW